MGRREGQARLSCFTVWGREFDIIYFWGLWVSSLSLRRRDPSLFLPLLSFRFLASHHHGIAGRKKQGLKNISLEVLLRLLQFCPTCKKKIQPSPSLSRGYNAFSTESHLYGVSNSMKNQGWAPAQHRVLRRDKGGKGRRKRLGICKGSALHALSQCPNRFELDSLVVVAFFSNPQWF